MKKPGPAATPRQLAAYERQKAMGRDWYRRNPEKRKAYEFARRPAGPRPRVFTPAQRKRGSDRARAFYLRNTALCQIRQRRILYKLTEDSYQELLALQAGLCGLCGRHPDIPTKDPAKKRQRPQIGLEIDHDHVTGRVRGLLCRQCNVGLGLFKDSPRLLYNAINYLNMTESQVEEHAG